jgi:hypothetical protein
MRGLVVLLRGAGLRTGCFIAPDPLRGWPDVLLPVTGARSVAMLSAQVESRWIVGDSGN